MKTINNVQKTENMKTSAVKSLVLLTAMAGFSLMAGAHENSRTQAIEEGNEILLAATASVPATLEGFMKETAETALEVESWMISEVLFASPVTVAEAFSKVESDDALEVENWMVSESYFASPLPVAETEEVLPVEEWMLLDQNFIETTTVEEGDQALEVETWMLNPGIWGR